MHCRSHRSLFKQLLMCSGYDRYFQIAKCFRDEDLRADRQPEFTQIDMELSFVDVDDVIEVNERLLAKLFKEVLGVDVSLPIQRMTWQEAMDRFGSDKPDIRFGMELTNVTDVVKDCEFVVFKNALKMVELFVVSTPKDRVEWPERRLTNWLILQRLWCKGTCLILQFMKTEL